MHACTHKLTHSNLILHTSLLFIGNYVCLILLGECVSMVQKFTFYIIMHAPHEHDVKQVLNKLLYHVKIFRYTASNRLLQLESLTPQQ